MNGYRVLLIVLCALLLLGSAIIYCFDNDDYNVEITRDGNTVRYDLSGTLPADYSYRVYSGTDVPEHLYIYIDEEYGSFFDIHKQRDFSRTLKTCLEARGYDSVSYVDASSLSELMKGDGSGAILFSSGTLPDTVSMDDVSSWFDDGGSIYWSGPDMGMYVSHRGGYERTDNGMFGNDVNDGKEFMITGITDIGKSMGLSLEFLSFGLRNDYPGSVRLSTYGDDYSSLSVLPVSNGRMFVFGSDLTDTVIAVDTAIAELIICGINENTELLHHGDGHKGTGNADGSLEIDPSAEMFYFSVGKPYSAWARGFQL